MEKFIRSVDEPLEWSLMCFGTIIIEIITYMSFSVEWGLLRSTSFHERYKDVMMAQ